MNRDLLIALAESLALTIVLETGFFLIAGKRDRRDLLLVVLVNVVTNPVVVLLYWLAAAYTALNAAAVQAALEVSAVVVEGIYYKSYGRSFRRPFLFSIGANAFSFGIGLLIQLL
ncbi:MAG: hypothetical protein FWF49_03960 [Oscillospiraceae bacterium]|nr:hypothetical protein [Oscillospiraceae bacterium]